MGKRESRANHDPLPPLSPTLRSDAAVRQILLALLDTMQRNEAGSVANSDSEFLHDFRIAVRRSRVLLGQAKRILPPYTHARFSRELAWLGGITSQTRDFDVFLLKYKEYRRQLPKRLRRDLDPLQIFLRQQHEIEHLKLTRALHSDRYAKLKQQWRRYLSASLAKRPVARDALTPVVETAHRRSWKIYQRVIRQGNAIDNDSPAAALHELRKSCKKLRYLMELFRPLYARKKIRQQIKALKQLQESLGAFQDLDVQIQILNGFTTEMRETLSSTTQRATNKLLKRLQRRMTEVRAEFDRSHKEFTRHSNQRQFRQLFHPDTPPTANPHD